MTSNGAKPSFQLPIVEDNELSWGPNMSHLDKNFNQIPYAPFSKSDRIGKFADWSNEANNRQLDNNRKQEQAYGASGENPFAFHNIDDASFSLVDSKTIQKKTTLTKGVIITKLTNTQKTNVRNTGNQKGNTNTKHNANNKQNNNRYGYNNYDRRTKDASVRIQPEWTVVEDIELNRIAKLSHNVIDPVDLSIHGQLYHYNKKFDKPTTNDSLLKTNNEELKYSLSTSEDPILQEYAKTEDATVFITDTILALLMCSPRSVQPWDILVNRIGDKLFFDKRKGGPIDSITVNENASDPPSEVQNGTEKENLNSPASLSQEALQINQAFLNQVLDSSKLKTFEKPNPFYDSNINTTEVGSAAYRYRRFELDTEIGLIVRTEVDGVQKGSDGTDKYLLVRALNEFDSKAQGSGGALDWRSKLDSQRGAVVATEMKNNNCKLTRWAVQAILANANLLKLGWVSRINPKDNRRHQILTTMQYRPNDFVSQMNFQFSSGWGIVYAIVRLCLTLEEGKYILVKDPIKPIVKLYSIPEDTESNDLDAPEMKIEGEDKNV
ncbi:translation initiation factor eIF-3, subunit D [Neoconidiobolus thromboides FSU 785]|nr:translation initiation factor eIF-3, subunit D [Neoconidiobolus thromboides FSU 785]